MTLWYNLSGLTAPSRRGFSPQSTLFYLLRRRCGDWLRTRVVFADQGRSWIMSPLSSIRKLVVSLALFAVVAVGSETMARADTVTFDLNRGSTLPNQNYGSITLTLVGNAIQVDISLLPGNRIVNTGFD